jgi:hypothetical protein
VEDEQAKLKELREAAARSQSRPFFLLVSLIVTTIAMMTPSPKMMEMYKWWVEGKKGNRGRKMRGKNQVSYGSYTGNEIL